MTTLRNLNMLSNAQVEEEPCVEAGGNKNERRYQSHLSLPTGGKYIKKYKVPAQDVKYNVKLKEVQV